MDARAGVIVTFFVRKGPKELIQPEILPGDTSSSTSGPHLFRIQNRSQFRQAARETWVHKIGAIVCTSFLLSVLSHAQMPSGGNVFFGYSYSRGNAFTQGFPAGTAGRTVNMNGWEASVEGKYLPWLGVVADLDWHYGSRSVTPLLQISASRHEIMFGPRASVSKGRYTPFAQALIGFTHQSDSGTLTSDSDTSFASAIGGGLDYKLLQVVAARGQLDYLHMSLFGGSQGHIRLSMGLVFRF